MPLLFSESTMPPHLGGSIFEKILAINSNAMPDMANLTRGPFTHVKYCFFPKDPEASNIVSEGKSTRNASPVGRIHF
jgi:hypothetical protein